MVVMESWPTLLSPDKIGVVTLVILVAFANWRGWIEFKPSSDKRDAMYEAMLADKDRQIERWEKSSADWQQAFQSRDQNIRDLITSAEATAHLLEALRREVEGTRGPTNRTGP